MFLFLMYLFILSPRHECKHHVAVRFPSTYFHLFLLISVMPRRGEFNILLTRKLIIFIVLPFPFLCLFFTQGRFLLTNCQSDRLHVSSTKDKNMKRRADILSWTPHFWQQVSHICVIKKGLVQWYFPLISTRQGFNKVTQVYWLTHSE